MGKLIRQAKLHDLDEIENVEKLCFPEEEAASKAAFLNRTLDRIIHWNL